MNGITPPVVAVARRTRLSVSVRTMIQPSFVAWLCIVVSVATLVLLDGSATQVNAFLLSPVSLRRSRPATAAIISTTTTTTTVTVLRATNNDNNDSNKKNKKKKTQGVYVRPSGAIERGSGFFVPGLEGPKVRLVIGIVLLAATAVNHYLLSFGMVAEVNNSQGFLSFSEGMAVVYSALLLFQSAIEFAKEALPAADSNKSVSSSSSKSSVAAGVNDASSSAVLEQQWSNNNNNNRSVDDDDDDDDDDGYQSKVQWAAASFFAMTPTTQIMLLTAGNEGGEIRYRLGGGGSNKSSNDDDGKSDGVQAALNELRQSKGGRIALPLTHPAVQALLSTTAAAADDGNGNDGLRTVILQRITDDSCWMVASDQLLAGYASGDLKWLGRLAGYVVA